MVRTFIVFLSLFFTAAAGAAERPFSVEAFAALQRQGGPILVSVHADWCPTCKKQDIILGELLKEDPESVVPQTKTFPVSLWA